MAVRDLIWVDKLLKEMNIEQSKAKLFIDNQSAIKLIKNPEHHARTKHLDIRLHHIRDHYQKELFDVAFVPTAEQKGDILTKGLSPQTHNSMISKIGLFSTICLLFFQSIMCTFHAEDLVIWRPTEIRHIYGQSEMHLSLGFMNPCSAIFDNITTAQKLNRELRTVCDKRYKRDIEDNLQELSKYLEREVREIITATVLVVTGISAIVMSTSAMIHQRETDEKIDNLKKITDYLNKQITTNQEKIIISEERLSTKMTAIDDGLKILADMLKIQPTVNEALFKVLNQIEESKKNIDLLKTKLKVGAEAPTLIIDMFNLGKFTDSATLRHSTVQKMSYKDGILYIKLKILMTSPDTNIFKADPFSYEELKDNTICTYNFIGPEYILHNKSSDCIRSVLAAEIDQDTLFGEGCTLRKAINNDKLFQPTTCKQVDKFNITAPRVQYKHDGKILKINCQSHSIILDGVKHDCPNHVFSVENTANYSIGDTTFLNQKFSFFRNSVDYEIPAKINLHHKTSRIAFQALNATDLQELNAGRKSDLYNRLSQNINKSNGSLFNELAEEIAKVSHALITGTGAYFAYACFVLLAYMYFQARRHRRNITPSTIVTCILLLPVIGADYNSALEKAYSAKEATSLIVELQNSMKDNKCSIWNINEGYEAWLKGEGIYPVTLSCALAGMSIECPCNTEAEYIPVLEAGKTKLIPQYVTIKCPNLTKDVKYSSERSLFEATSKYLCNVAPTEVWPKHQFGQLVAAACSLSKLAFNCHCASFSEHMALSQDLPTLKATERIVQHMQTRKSECTNTEEANLHQKLIRGSSVRAQLFDIE